MRILLVEDESDLALAIKQVLINERYVVDWVADGTQAWLCLESQWTDYTVAIVDWLLPEMSGLELCQKLRLHQNPLPVLMLTALGQPENRVAGLDAGADDYLVKPFVMEELLARLRALQRRSPQLQPSTLTVAGFTLDTANNVLQVNSDGSTPLVIPLTTKEFQLLMYLMQNPNRIIPGSKLRHQLWDMDEEPISNVVAAQMRLLRRKLANHGCPCPIETVPGAGYRFNSQVDSHP
ncbi:two-component system response regulator RppA [Umezakia ovalisporum]|jgi:two-component system Ni(II)/redox-responsive regulator NrsR|uniref:Response regulator transcription factor n=2 Tax=Umezakia ovalisporum TaxID=75695 RepID=A0AA43GXH8_9CYAN|nr:two-component system response regulator RppA [Umezakia ovalisporum]MBI1241619.1 response regulator [Nostoc sp. RI_552]MDH6057361.1 response regulator transcription factor [Umezakia ovalisporum FSS-43]MDH6063574.1 response regulator transcription factor [Umezakia ovalisporum FSS-62]MDH6065979.1 response regulator transcription factor [Umezakia ovalisporum APH033B]MDH6072499.1 response regulator transcription factor [Umezakia ovalisporum CobakiLakeA]